MPRGSSSKRERQYEHIKESAEERGESTKRAKEIAARTVNKERARAGESRTASKSSTQDMSSSKRGGQRSHSGSEGPTYDQLYAEAQRRNIQGRSSMNKSGAAVRCGGPVRLRAAVRCAPEARGSSRVPGLVVRRFACPLPFHAGVVTLRH
jgi:hypothetical protein